MQNHPRCVESLFGHLLLKVFCMKLPAMLTLHHLNNSRSQRVLWILEELDLKYEIRRYERDPQTLRAPVALAHVHPLGKSPVLEDNQDGHRDVVAESGAILEYVVDKYGQGRLRPKDGTPGFLKYRFWMHFAEGSMMSPLLVRLIMDQVEKAPLPFFVKPIAKKISQAVKERASTPEITRQLDFVESELQKTPWLAGEAFTAADIQMSFPLEAAQARGLLGSRRAIAGYLDQLRMRPAYQRALKAGGSYDLNYG